MVSGRTPPRDDCSTTGGFSIVTAYSDLRSFVLSSGAATTRHTTTRLPSLILTTVHPRGPTLTMGHTPVGNSWVRVVHAYHHPCSDLPAAEGDIHPLVSGRPSPVWSRQSSAPGTARILSTSPSSIGLADQSGEVRLNTVATSSVHWGAVRHTSTSPVPPSGEVRQTASSSSPRIVKSSSVAQAVASSSGSSNIVPVRDSTGASSSSSSASPPSADSSGRPSCSWGRHRSPGTSPRVVAGPSQQFGGHSPVNFHADVDVFFDGSKEG